MDVLGFLSDFLGILANFIVYPISYLSIILSFIGFCLDAVIKYISLIINILPPFLKPFALMILMVRLIKFIMGRSNGMYRSSRVVTPEKSSDKVQWKQGVSKSYLVDDTYGTPKSEKREFAGGPNRESHWKDVK